MKKFLILFVWGLLSSLAFAQESTQNSTVNQELPQHMIVNGVEMNGTPQEFVKQMKKKGLNFLKKIVL